MTDRAEIFEVGPRDGLQNEPGFIPTDAKIALVDLLSGAGFRRIEVASFVSPKWVPQMADGAQVLAGITRARGVSYGALTPNLTGFEGAVAAKADEIAIFGSASEGFSRANLNRSVDEALAMFAPVADAARAAGLPMRGYVSCVTHCPFDGATAPRDVIRVARAMAQMGCYEISLGDTIGQAHPGDVTALLRALLEEFEPGQLAGHFHNTAGRAVANIGAALALGLRVFDAAVGGLGGCPYAPGAAGNVATEEVAAFLAAQGIKTGLNTDILQQGAAMARAMRN